MTYYETIKNTLLKYLDKKQFDYKVIVLSGPWGSGKTYLVKSLPTNYFYASLFGVKSIEEIKEALLLSKLGRPKQFVEIGESLANLVKELSKSIDNLPVLPNWGGIKWIVFAQNFLNGKTIVLDDIERRDRQLTIQDLFGFVNDFKEEHDCNFILILDKEKLSSDDGVKPDVEDESLEWRKYSEKIIDEEIYIHPTCEDVFKIAESVSGLKMPKEQLDVLQTACQLCNLKNIRIVKKILKLTAKFVPASEIILPKLNRLIPPIVLLAAVHYRAFKYSIDLKSLKNISPYSYLNSKEQNRKEIDFFSRLLRDLRIREFSSFESLLIDFFEKGIYNKEAIEKELTKISDEEDLRNISEQINLFVENVRWNVDLSFEQLRVCAAQIQDVAALLSPRDVDDFIMFLEKVPDTETIRNNVLAQWSEQYKTGDKKVEFSHEISPYYVKEVRDVLQEANDRFSSMKYEEVFQWFALHQGYTEKEQLALSKITESELSDYLIQCNRDQFHQFVKAMFSIKKYPSLVAEMQTLKQGCLKVIQTKPNSHLALSLELLSKELELAFD